jgi:hypothetical protein
MNEPAHGSVIRARTRFEAAAVGLRLAHSVAGRFGLSGWSDPAAPAAGQHGDALLAALRFIAAHARGFGLDPASQAAWRDDIARLRAGDDGHPLNRLARAAADSALGNRVVDLVLLAGLPELHECFATLCRLLHPDGLPCPTPTLALHWLEGEAQAHDTAAPDAPYQVRDSVEELLLHSPLARLGLLRLEGDGPWHSRQLRPGPGVWDALCGRPPRLDHATLVAGETAVPGLGQWLEQDAVRRAAGALRRGEPCLVAVLGGGASMRATRVKALLGAAGLAAVHARIDADPATGARAALDAYCAAFMQRACPWLAIEADDGVRLRTPGVTWELPVLASAAAEHTLPDLGLPVLALRIEPLPALARRAMWQALLPQLAEHAGLLAARYPVGPEDAREVAADLVLWQRVDQRALGLHDVGAALRARALWRARPGVRRVLPAAGWHSLLLPPSSLEQLRQAVLRVHQQITVLDDWGFEQGRQDRRGLRMLFFGPPGTGKTLAAEAMAHALGVDLLVVDIASLVSKWIGETEKNLAAVFELAESSRALLLFDEADALFGRRTEAGDANDRHANLETAFLLQRIERYEGVAVLTTNLRNNLDNAFTRRFEYIVEFPAPDAGTRQALWRLHLPAPAPLASDVDLEQLAAWYPLSGAQVRNAALGAAFLAAAEGGAIAQRHFLHAIEREYDKAGKAHPGKPPQPHR